MNIILSDADLTFILALALIDFLFALNNWRKRRKQNNA